MLKKLTVKQRMYIIITAILALFVVMSWFAIQNGIKARDMGIAKTGEIMLADQKAKIQVATHTAAITVGHAIADIADKNQRIETIRKLLADIRFEEDKSGYFFVYENTTNIALPTNTKLQGQDLGGLKDKNGVHLVSELRNVSKKGGGFVTYIWPKPPENVDVAKLSYAEMIPGTEMWIGTGVFLDNVETYQNSMKTAISAQVRKTTISMLIISGRVITESGV